MDALITEMMRPTFWLAALQIMGINILLSGDNAVVIALAVRALPPKERFWGMVLGAGAAAVLLIVFTGIVATLMKLPYLKLAVEKNASDMESMNLWMLREDGMKEGRCLFAGIGIVHVQIADHH